MNDYYCGQLWNSARRKKMTNGPRVTDSLSPTNLGNRSGAVANDLKADQLFANLQARTVYLAKFRKAVTKEVRKK